MKLNTKIVKTYLINSAVVFILVVITIILVTNYLIKTEIDEQLESSRNIIISNLKDGIDVNFPPLIQITGTNEKAGSKFIIKDTTVYSPSEKENEPYRELSSIENVNGKNYKIVIRTSLVEKEDLFASIAIILSFLSGALILILIILNQKTTRDILKPFYYNLNQLNKFSIKNSENLDLQISKIDEFSELNTALLELTKKAKKEYKLLKEFTEDVNHELQTPIAVIKSKLELLLQNEKLDESTLNTIQIIHKNIDRLTKTNKSIVLLSKLENKNFFESKNISLREELLKVLENYKDFAASKNIIIESEMHSGLDINMNEQLLNILLSNLISNSIRHNIENGKVEIILHDNEVTIRNSGKEKIKNPEKIFERFFKQSKNMDSLGLGLAIVKKICELYNINVDYFFDAGKHNFQLVFPQN